MAVEPADSRARALLGCYLACALLLAGGLLVQVFFSGVAIFGDASYWQAHMVLGGATVVPILAMLVTGLLGRLPGWMIWATVSLLVAFAFLYGCFHVALVLQAPWLRALHPVDGVIMLVIDAGLAAAAAQEFAASFPRQR